MNLKRGGTMDSITTNTDSTTLKEETQPAKITIEKLIDVGEDMYNIDIKQGMRVMDSYSLEDFRNCNIKIKIEIEKIEVNWIGDDINE